MPGLATQISPEQAESIGQWALLVLAIAISGLLLIVVVALLVLAHRRRVAARERRQAAQQPVDAWSEAGRRLQAPDDEGDADERPGSEPRGGPDDAGGAEAGPRGGGDG